MQVILQDAEMRWMLWDECLRPIPDLQAIANQEPGTRQAGLYDCYRCGGDHVAYLQLLLNVSRLKSVAMWPDVLHHLIYWNMWKLSWMQAVQVTEEKSKINNCNNCLIKEMIVIEQELLTCIRCLMTQVINYIHDRIQ